MNHGGWYVLAGSGFTVLGCAALLLALLFPLPWRRR